MPLRRRAAADDAAPPSGAPPSEKPALRQPRSRTCTWRVAASLLAVLTLLLLVNALVQQRPLTLRGVLAPVSGANFLLMRFFRDLSRAKARRRRFGQRHALMPVLLGREAPLPLEDASLGLGLTLEELSEFS